MYKPDFENLRKALLREGPVKKIPSWELFLDVEIMEHFLGERLAIEGLSKNNSDARQKLITQLIDLNYKLGYDYCRSHPAIGLTFTNRKSTANTAQNAKADRAWVDDSSSTIANWEDFENYPWPKIEDIDYSLVEQTAKMMPEGMKVMFGTSGVLENVQWLMGYEPMALAMYDEPELVAALFDKVGALLAASYEYASQIDNVGLMAMGDDMGFKGGTLFPPDFLRKHVFPWQKKCVDAAHKNGQVFILHSCGQIDEIMNDLIDYVGIDARHSYEDAITPVEDAYKKYSSRVSIVGGVHVDLLARGSEADVRKRVRQILETCAPGGGYVMGSGNSVANYVNINNYIAMLDETRRFEF